MTDEPDSEEPTHTLIVEYCERFPECNLCYSQTIPRVTLDHVVLGETVSTTICINCLDWLRNELAEACPVTIHQDWRTNGNLCRPTDRV